MKEDMAKNGALWHLFASLCFLLMSFRELLRKTLRLFSCHMYQILPHPAVGVFFCFVLLGCSAINVPSEGACSLSLNARPNYRFVPTQKAFLSSILSASHSERVQALRYLQLTRQLLSCSADGGIAVWNMDAQREEVCNLSSLPQK